MLRAQIVLAAAEGKENRIIAAELGTDRLPVGKWRQRFADQGLAGLEKDAPRGGRKPTASHALAATIADNYSTHKHPKVKKWLKRHPRFHRHFIPTSRSWRNMVQRWFREIADKRIRRDAFTSVP